MTSTAGWHAIQRRRQRQNPEEQLHLSFRVQPGENANGDTQDVFGSSSVIPWVFAFEVERLTGTPNGVLWDIGGAVVGVAAYVSGSDLVMVAGGSEQQNSSIVATAALPAAGVTAKVCYSANPVTGRMMLFVNGNLIGETQSVVAPYNSFFVPTGPMNIGTISSACVTLVPAPNRVAVSGARINGPLRVYKDQRLRQN